MTEPTDWIAHAISVGPLQHIELARDLLRGVPPSEAYGLRVKGDSLTGSQLKDGDELVMRKTGKPEHKKLMHLEADGRHMVRWVFVETIGLAGTPTGRLYLKAANEDVEAIIAEPGTWAVLGKVVMVIRHV